MRPPYRSVTPAVVRDVAVEHLTDALPWTATRTVPVDQLLRLLLPVATGATSRFDIVRRRFAFTHHAAYRAAHANTASAGAVAAGVNRGPHAVLHRSRLDRRRRRVVALDTHLVPYHGRRTGAAVGGPRKAGTTYFHGYATAALVEPGRRYTAALEPYPPGDRPHELVRRLLDRVAGAGPKVRGVTADSGFDGGDTLLLLRGRGPAYAAPLRRKGRGTNARNRVFGPPPDRVHTATRKAEAGRRPVTTAVYVWRRRGGGRAVVAVAFAGWGAAAARRATRAARATYRTRFGIETSDRQENRARGFTTSRSPAYRLLLEGSAHLIRQVWVLLTEPVAGSRRVGWVHQLPLAALIDWLDDARRAGLHEARESPVAETG
jgi:hypothetical protein